MIETILKQHSSQLIGAVAAHSELDTNQAEALLPPALGNIGDVLRGGDIDLASLLGDGGPGVGALLEKLDVGAIASQAGLEEGQARGGLAALLPLVISLLGDKAGGADGLVSMLGGLTGNSQGGGLGAIGGLAGKLFGR